MPLYSALTTDATLERRHREQQPASDLWPLKRAAIAAGRAGVLRSLSFDNDAVFMTASDPGPGERVSVSISDARFGARWLSEKIRAIGAGWQLRTTEENWTRLLDAMSALAETLPWREVSP